MLVLTRQPNGSIIIGRDIEVKVLVVQGKRVCLGIVAPSSVPVHRKEVFERIARPSQPESTLGDGQQRNLAGARARPADHNGLTLASRSVVASASEYSGD
jgi:carbon storage regulator